MKLSIPKERHPNEKRVAATPTSVGKLIKLGHTVCVESGAGLAARYDDDAYREAGADIVDSPDTLWREAEFILKVRPPEHHSDPDIDEASLLPDNARILSFLWPAQNPELIEDLAKRNITAFSIDALPRISRAQKMDALSAMGNIAGYRAVVEAAEHFGRFFTGQVTAAGKVQPAKVLIIGAGVAGLAAIGTARGMGAIVRAFDTRPEVKEQVESMGAEFLELDFEEDASGGGGYAKQMSKEFIEAEMALFAEQAKEVDIIITTALIPGKPAPRLISAEMVRSMKPGSVVVDLAAEQGGNCELSQPDEVVVDNHVSIVGYTDLVSRMASVSSDLYSTNLYHLLTELTPEKDGEIKVNMDDTVIRGVTVAYDGSVTWPPPQPEQPTPKPAQPKAKPEPSAEQAPQGSFAKSFWKGALLVVTIAALYGVGAYAPETFLSHFTVFVLSCFIGWQVIWNVTASLHTPLMSVTNAISGIIVIGAILHLAQAQNVVIGILAFIAVLIASINIGGGFRVTYRMLKMFHR
ncbi:Re/Si-specific NAD(P)(+) transhydrogenase subunit alpha [Marinobacter nanhaiticus D15-8W]|uniref:NAD(P) transhydrogenase subunit alpha n=1 Tax=Marinobacter nanhaiticus D15-8W TaxID=626887 RepID=N6W139_9GAMM|nr:Re/Si-specific NAD(P)(+) transhydrogenase subunit alpha [Marinobacter nanhaiticus]ENO16215.1 Re/Si-specific NAD(P)(+) transhydrogenase subunit alpha [Marinobacter nanhaiticus D15-8W]BES72929.1 Re/Si-specific NAD(P)(+) transhydrogenase subunit alpha [Marinobacter nanhaiticus D15-8W]